ncbi:MAG: glycosyltransferase family 1 protein [Oscillospiraceae bacterium]|nr:glycosyltransferase family 1 protein [Oscillospiraceae bacterium]
MIRVLHMIASLDVGGSQTMMMNIYRKIDRDRIQFDFVIDRPEETYFAAEIRELGGRVYTLPAFRGTNAGEIKRDWNNFFYTHPEYHILHSHVRSYASLYLPVARAHGVKTIIHSHSTSTGGGVKGAVKTVMQLPLRHQADVLMACSRDAGEWLYGKRACQSERFVLLPNGIDTERFILAPGTRERYRRDLGLEERFVIGNVGRFYDVKNHTFLLDVFQKIREREPRAVLLLVGVGPLQQQMAQKAVDLGVAEDVIMTGNRTDVPELLGAMDVFAFPSLWEGLPMTVVEAQAAGLPCVLSDTITREVDVSPLVEYLPLGDAAQWADALLRRRERMDAMDAMDAIRRAGFDIRSSAQKLTEIYTALDREAGL